MSVAAERPAISRLMPAIWFCSTSPNAANRPMPATATSAVMMMYSLMPWPRCLRAKRGEGLEETSLEIIEASYSLWSVSLPMGDTLVAGGCAKSRNNWAFVEKCVDCFPFNGERVSSATLLGGCDAFNSDVGVGIGGGGGLGA